MGQVRLSISNLLLVSLGSSSRFQVWEKNRFRVFSIHVSFFRYFIFRYFIFKQNYTLFSCEKTLPNIIHEREEPPNDFVSHSHSFVVVYDYYMDRFIPPRKDIANWIWSLAKLKLDSFWHILLQLISIQVNYWRFLEQILIVFIDLLNVKTAFKALKKWSYF